MAADIKQLFEAGAHFGHRTSRWNPKMSKYIFTKKDGIHVINLDITVEQINKASEFLAEIAGRGRQILFVGTGKQAKDVAKTVAEATGQPYVTERWLGGMLTNSQTIVSQIKKLKLLEKRMASGELANRYNKLEVQRYQEEIDALNVRYGGIKEMRGKPGAVVVLSAVCDKNAIAEACKLNIPVVAICDTNADPTGIDYVIPANDDAITALQLIVDQLAEGVKAGATVAAKRAEERKAAAADKDEK
ncbi:MAG: 30S ribosomal protein S2 [Candidatus Saccharibacteria bacterium]|nr:30S ribosomal protein S2 [Candidatus Saccharibacteria bacterium]